MQADEDESCKVVLAGKHVKMWKSGSELTSIVASHNSPHRRRRDDQRIGNPTPAGRRRTSSNADDIVPPRLHDVMKQHLQRWKARTPKQINRTCPPLLALSKPQARPLSIHDLSQRSQYTRHRARHPNSHGDRDLDFNVAEHSAFEPVCDVVMGPEDGVEKVLQVED